MKTLRLILAAVWIISAPMLPALAQATAIVTTPGEVPVVVVQDPVVTIPYGEWIVALQGVAVPLFLGAIAFLVRNLPGSIVSIIYTSKVQQLLEKGVQFAVNRVAGASRDKKMTVPVANKVVREIVQYAVTEGPAWLIKWAGGPEGIKAKAIARIQVVEGAAIEPAEIVITDIKKA